MIFITLIYNIKHSMNDALLITQKTGDTLYYQFQKKEFSSFLWYSRFEYRVVYLVMLYFWSLSWLKVDLIRISQTNPGRVKNAVNKNVGATSLCSYMGLGHGRLSLLFWGWSYSIGCMFYIGENRHSFTENLRKLELKVKLFVCCMWSSYIVL